ncbi:P-type conjugative transfer protein VirB9 [Pokkaliibacter sp. MBI-7]|uniref:P-type conjugative transfer protein VirB9 n=1 Tax=Pokkaliibacter sp. MBI-7 TaxID=3040600 RepID=UPI0024468398|nr:P-type conjugative transfer protein VirB9 [Pokkaliibacter sp. MBI-7]MDH2436871.1 P-type conjugative transfer protein VirB9 [Pokkaliibacter sp. MBI-7]
MKKLAFCLALATVTAAPAWALETPSASSYDHRVRYVTFNQADVVQLDAVVGVATHIILEEGERYQTHAFGDSGAYEFGIKGNHIFIKPRAEQANTNLIVVTDRRSYKFRLTFRPDRRNATYELAFRYPDTQARQSRQARERAAVERGFQMEAGGYNLSYTMSGDTDIAPVNAWDNGQMTFFKFAANADMPAIYMVDAEGNESIVNRHTVGSSSDIVVVHKVSPKWVIRLGNRALAIWNEAYDPNGVPNETGTASPGVRRVIRGGTN